MKIFSFPFLPWQVSLFQAPNLYFFKNFLRGLNRGEKHIDLSLIGFNELKCQLLFLFAGGDVPIQPGRP